MLARIRFSGVFLLFDDTSDGRTWVLFPNPRRASSAKHEPRLNFRDLERSATTLASELLHDVVPDARGDSVLSVPLQGENQLQYGTPREVRLDGPGAGLTIDPSIDHLYDLALGGVTKVYSWQDPVNRDAIAARILLDRGKLLATQRVPGRWELNGVEFPVLLDALEWKVEFDVSLRVVLGGGAGGEADKVIELLPNGEELQISFTSFSSWYSEKHPPSFASLESLVESPGPHQAPVGGGTYGLRLSWPERVGGASPSVYCPSGRFKGASS